MGFDPQIAATRFGTGLSPKLAPPGAVSDMLVALKGPDDSAARFPIAGFDAHLTQARETARLLPALRRARKGGDAAADKAIRQIRKARAMIDEASFRATLMRGVAGKDTFRERLTAFWADHFTTRAHVGPLQMGTGAYVDSAIRPHVAGRFSDLLVAAVTHPVMLVYLDQSSSVGPNSPMARRKRGTGLNENLARETLELHTLGVTGPYTQRDVRALAELLTGMTFSLADGGIFRTDLAEPGKKTVLGKSYGGPKRSFGDVRAVLEDLARHPATADHIAWKLAVHFTADAPDPDLVRALRAAFIDSAGDLMAVYAALLAHPAAWVPDQRNVKPPFLYMISALRALGVPEAAIMDLSRRDLRRLLLLPLRNMGHRWLAPRGPDGLSEADTDWASPPNLAARIQWALTVPGQLGPLPDPRRFVADALGPRAPETVRFAAGAAEIRREGVGLVLISPAFQRI